MFKNARISLTAFYLIAIMSVSIIFSTVIYKVVTSELLTLERNQRFRIERRFQDNKLFLDDNSMFPLPPNTELLVDTSHRVLFRLTIINVVIFIVSGVVGYILAGRTLKPIADMVDEQNRFITDASHELRTPLTSLRSGFEVFLRNRKATLPLAKTLVIESIDEVNKLDRLSSALLNLAYYQKPDDTFITKKVNLDEVINTAIKKTAAMATNKKIKVSYSKKSVFIKGDGDRLRELFVILLDNAIKYSPPKNDIILKVVKKGGKVTVLVIDHGIGIEKKDIPHIFDRFYRADHARTKSDSNGFGLGLSIAKKIVEQHKGSITVESTLNKGSEFNITFSAYS